MRSQKLVTVSASLFLAMASAGDPPPSAWTEVGSVNLAGRTHQAAFDESTGKLYVGSALGGLWRSDFDPGSPNPATLSWVPLSDGVYGGARGVVIIPGAPPIILKTHSGSSTGEVHRSTDGGSTWSVVATLNGQAKRIIRPFASPTTVFVMARDCCAARSTLYRSIDAGASFQLLRSFSSYEADIWISRTGLGPLFLLANNTLEVSGDEGLTWSVRGTLSLATARRAALTGSEVGLPRLYAVAMTANESSRRLQRSDDGGFTWVDKGVVSDFWSDHTSLSVSSRNANVVLYGGLECWRSTNGGTTFQKINAFGEYYGNPAARLHSDITSIDFVPLAGNEEGLFIGTSGGAYFSKDGGATVVNLSLHGLRVGQYFSTLSDAVDPARIAAGSQDQGYQIGSSTDGQFLQRIAGDFGQLTSSNGTHDLVFASHPSFVLAVERQGAATNIFVQDLPAGEAHAWLAPLAADPLGTGVVYLGARHLHRYELADGSWTVTPLPFDFQGQPGEFVAALAIAPSDPDRWYVATSLGRFFCSPDSGTTWMASTFTSIPAPQNLTGLAIAVHPENAGVVAVGGTGFSNPAVFLSMDGGASFSPLGSGQPQTLVTGLAWGPLPSRDLYAGAESGPWRYVLGRGSWESVLGMNAPLTQYWSVERTGNVMRFGTLGRGIWDYSVCPAPPAGIPALTMTKTAGGALLEWTDGPSSMAYDVVRGSVDVLRSSGGDFASATTACLADDALVPSLSDAAIPAAGSAYWYLVRPVNCAGSGTYDSGGSGQAGSRDPGIESSPNHCL